MTSRYIHGTSPGEQARLSLLNELHNGRCLDALALRRGDRVVDFGCGLGQLTAAMAERVGPTGRVLGIEREEAQLAAARALVSERGLGARVELRQGDVVTPPLEAGEPSSFDVAHARFVLEHLPDPQAAVSAMAGAVHPGGRVVLVDDDHDLMRLWPACPEGLALWQHYFASYAALDNDPLVGRKLVTLLVGAGLADCRFRLLDYSTCHDDPAFAGSLENVVEVVRGAKDSVLAYGTGWSSERFDRALDELVAWGERPDATLSYSFCWAQACRP